MVFNSFKNTNFTLEYIRFDSFNPDTSLEYDIRVYYNNNYLCLAISSVYRKVYISWDKAYPRKCKHLNWTL